MHNGTPDNREHDRHRRAFLELCGRMGLAVPPAVVLLASTDGALASNGGRKDDLGVPPGPPSGGPPGPRG